MKKKEIRIAGAIVLVAVGLLVFFGTRLATTPIDPTKKAASSDVPEDAVRIDIRTLKNRWTWDPKVLEVNVGDHVVITAINEDAYDHGLTIAAFNVFEVLPARSEIVIQFVADAEGDFNFYCSIPCGAGHQNMTGKLIVSPAVSIGENQNIDVLGETAPDR